ncbi:alpha/beta hydrolase [Pedobacter arcticus]|uniref:alpha/beta hydrolase n=1 Tax=Pedobacter arcticus TaxID=752140 RepID=UPI0002EF2B22|nr:alpha/beta hydrolase family protein [Pedobacter arcticus]
MKTNLSLNKIIFFLILFISFKSFGATVDTVNTFSPSMNKQIKAVVLKPDSYDNKKTFPVVYLLHGYSGNYSNWANKVPAIKNLVDEYQLMIVCPDGNYGSWYFDAPKAPESKYETYVAKELVEWIDKTYKTIANKNNRAITGLSMGGHGALYLAFKHQDVYSVAGSMSGGVDFRPFPLNWDIAKSLGTYADNKENWDNNTVMELTNLLTPKSLALIIQCGTEDFFYNVNVKLHEKLLFNNIPHTFITNPGKHNWDYWGEAIQYQLLYIQNHFKSAK